MWVESITAKVVNEFATGHPLRSQQEGRPGGVFHNNPQRSKLVIYN